jgi:ribbon-helix-helix CopG family protein
LRIEGGRDDIVVHRRSHETISFSVSDDDYEAFRAASRDSARSIAELIREAMTFYRQEKLQPRTPLLELVVLPGHQPIGCLPSRAELQDEIFAGDGERRE